MGNFTKPFHHKLGANQTFFHDCCQNKTSKLKIKKNIEGDFESRVNNLEDALVVGSEAQHGQNRADTMLLEF